MFSAYKVLENREKDEIDEVSVLTYSYRKSVRINIHKVHGNGKWKYPNKISNFIFHISNLTEGFYDISRSDRLLS